MSETAEAPDDIRTDEATEQPTPKRRGRKPKNADTAPATTETQDAPNATDDKPVRRKRGAKPEAVDGFAKKLQGAYALVAVLTQAPAMNLSDGEARVLAESSLDVMREFDLEVAGKYAAIASLVVAAAMVNIPRAVYLVNINRQRRAMAMPQPAAPDPADNGNPAPTVDVPFVPDDSMIPETPIARPHG